MLSRICINNIALIDRLELELRDGLNILSGETGAGKSIIIDSLNFVLGERTDKSLVRYGTDSATVEAVFENYIDKNIEAYLSDVGIEVEEILILRRKMSKDGKNECRINGRVVTLSVLKGLTELLVDIHGQHEHQFLLRPSNHLTILDSMGGEVDQKALENMRSCHERYSKIKRELAEYGDGAERARKLDILSYQLEEIERADIKEGEEEALLAQRKRIRNMEKIMSALQAAKDNLDGMDGMGVGANLKLTASTLNSIAGYDDSISAIVDRLDSAKLEIEDIGDTLSDMLDRLDFDGRSAEKLEERLEIVRNITRKYGGSYSALREFYDNAAAEAEILSGADALVEKLEKELISASREMTEAAQKLSDVRVATADKLEKNIIKELGELSMGGSSFKVDIQTDLSSDSISENGGDRVEFLISPNVGEPLKPLAKIISGGEMSRFMLALKNILAGIDGIGTMVFDEIDTGISGNVSAVVSQKLCNISRTRQVIAVTHMPGLAAMADNHYLISKSEQGGKTLTHVELLEDDTDEVARLIGGNTYSAYAVPHAKEMKAWAQNYKDGLKQKI